MAKVKFDVSGVEAGGGGGLQPKPGMYKAKIAEINERDSSSGNGPMLEVKLEITTDSKGKKTEFKGAGVYTYILLEHEPTAFKLREFLEAVGLVNEKKAKGVLDTTKLIGDEVQVQIKPDTYNDEYKARVGKLLKLAESGDDEDEEDDEDEAAGDDGEDEDYTEWSVDELKEEAEERELDIPKKKGAALKKALIALLEEDDESEDEDEDEEDEDEGGDDEYSEEELKELALSELKEIAEEAGAEIEGKATKSKLVKAIIEARESDEDGDDDEDGEDEEDYSEWSIEDLKAELSERELKTTGSKKLLISRLEKDDESSEDPF